MRKEINVAQGKPNTQSQQSAPTQTRNRTEDADDQRSPDPGAIQTKAYEIYTSRIGRGAPGDAISDWLAAEGELRGDRGGSGSRKQDRHDRAPV